MYINNVNSAANIYTSGAVASTRYANSVSGTRNVQRNDALTLSHEAQSFKSMLQKLQDESEVRPEKVSEFEQKIASGNYNVAAENIAASILSSRF